MKAWFAVVAGVLLLSSSTLAQSANDPTMPRRKIPKHAMMATSPDRGRGAFNVVVGSDIKITPYGEVIVPPTTIISVDDRIMALPPAHQPDKIRPAAAAPLDLNTAPIDPSKAPPPSVPAQP